MSHVTEIKLIVKDLDALAEAADECGFEFRRDQKTHAWYGKFVGDTTPPAGRNPEHYGQCEHALRLHDHQPGDYEIGVVKALDGDGFTFLMDSWSTHGQRLLAKTGGLDFSTLKREYAAAVATRKAKQKLGPKGWSVKRENLEGGRIRLRVLHR